MSVFGRRPAWTSLLQEEKLSLSCSAFYESLILLAHFFFFFVCVEEALSETLSGNFGS